MTFEGIPEVVKRAREAGNILELRRLGHLGGEHAAISRIITKTKKAEAIAERVEELARVEKMSPEGDVLPPEPLMVEDVVVH